MLADFLGGCKGELMAPSTQDQNICHLFWLIEKSGHKS